MGTRESCDVTVKNIRPLVARIVGLFLISWTAGCGNDSHSRASVSSVPVSGNSQVVIIKQLKFQPDVVTVSAGETVTWKNEDIIPHTATSDAKVFDSGTIAVGESWSWKASARPGDYFYTCKLHPNMKAKLTVR